jgi:hypothetical protein
MLAFVVLQLPQASAKTLLEAIDMRRREFADALEAHPELIA